jgi:hypothetical protein
MEKSPALHVCILYIRTNTFCAKVSKFFIYNFGIKTLFGREKEKQLFKTGPFSALSRFFRPLLSSAAVYSAGWLHFALSL